MEDRNLFSSDSLLDARFFYTSADGRGGVTSEFVRQVISQYMRVIKGTALVLSPSFATTILLSRTNPCVLGYQVETMVLSHIAQNGFSEASSKFKWVEQIYFFVGGPKLRPKDETALYAPQAFNYKAVDEILIHRHLEKSQKVIIGNRVNPM